MSKALFFYENFEALNMQQIRIDADALFRAITATGYKLMAYHLDLKTGEVISRTLRPEEVTQPPAAPSVKPLPKMGGDLTPARDAQPFGPPPVTQPKKKLFADDDAPKKSAFDGDFFKRDEKKRPDLFGDGGFRKESGSKKLAEIFGEGPPKKKIDPFAKPESEKHEKPAAAAATPAAATPSTTPVAPDDPEKPRIPAISENQYQEWLYFFAKDSGDPQIRDELLAALKSAKPAAGFDRVMRKYQRLSQQWDRYYRKMALITGETWLSDLGIAWELIENE